MDLQKPFVFNSYSLKKAATFKDFVNHVIEIYGHYIRENGGT
jgi:hypothetical protein